MEHFEREREMEHFSHDHPLILLNTEHTEDDDGWAVSCYGCEQPISSHSSYYGCNRCLFFLHKSCADLPLEITHPSHPEHPLSLLPNPPPCYYRGGCCCDVCGENCYGFIYHCSTCKFDVDMKCASIVHSIQQRIKHKRHTHQLIPLQKPANFLCDACGIKHEGASYLCTTCGFWVNQKCADSLPTTIKLTNHHHLLILMYSVPGEYYEYLKTKCKICDEILYRRNWVYCRASARSERRYFVHVNCATSETTEHHSTDCKTEKELKDLDLNLIQLNSVDSGITSSNMKLSKDCKVDTIKNEVLDLNFITLPVSDESIDLMTQFIKGMRLQGKYKEATEIQHVSHDHPLIFLDKQIDRESCSGSGLPLLNELVKNNDEKCNGCAQIISTPFFYCAQCNFFLHEWCAEFHTELRHPFHLEHPLLLTTQYDRVSCRCCRLVCNTFMFGCSACKFFLDCKCASLPRKVKHEVHKHNLALRQRWSGTCNACNNDFYFFGFAFVCDPCNVNLCVRCTLLPGTVRHRYDKHPFTLTYSPPLKDEAVEDEYICEICEKEINPKLWFFHCTICDQSLHTQCILPIDFASNFKFGATIMDEDHPHLLTFVQSPEEISAPCSTCGEPYNSYWHLNYECAPCNYCIYFCVEPNFLSKEI